MNKSTTSTESPAQAGSGSLFYLIGFVPWLLWQVLVSTMVVVIDGLRPTSTISPGIIALPVRVDKDWEITLFATAITMTPGTMTIGLRQREDNTRELIVHGVFAEDEQAFIDSLREMENHVAPRIRHLTEPAVFPAPQEES